MSCAPTGFAAGSRSSPSSPARTQGATFPARSGPAASAYRRRPPRRPRRRREPSADGGDLGIHDQFRARVAGRRGERAGDRAHPADGHPPLAGAVADQVVEEAAVLDQRRVVHPRERADQRVGGDHAAHGLVAEALLQRLAERPLGQLPPQDRVGLLPQFRLPRQRLGERRRDGRGELADLPVELDATPRTRRRSRSARAGCPVSAVPPAARRAGRPRRRRGAPGCRTRSSARQAAGRARGPLMIDSGSSDTR